MRDTVVLVLALAGVALFVAGDVLWLVGRRSGRPIDLRRTGALIAAGVLLVLLSIVVGAPGG